jgi:hypothetical protein
MVDDWTELLQDLAIGERLEDFPSSETPDWTRRRTLGLTELAAWLSRYGPRQPE